MRRWGRVLLLRRCGFVSYPVLLKLKLELQLSCSSWELFAGMWGRGSYVRASATKPNMIAVSQLSVCVGMKVGGGEMNIKTE